MSFSSAPSRSGLLRSQRNMRMWPLWPSGGVEKSALSTPAESWMETVTRSLPLPPLLKLSFWKLYDVSVKPYWYVMSWIMFTM